MRCLLPLVEIFRNDRIGLAAQVWFVPAPAKAVVTSANQESEGGREEGRWTSEHLFAEEETIMNQTYQRKKSRGHVIVSSG